MVPGILRDVGDIAHIATLIAPRQVTISGGVTGGGKALEVDPLREQFTFARSVFSILGTDSALRISDSKLSLD